MPDDSELTIWVLAFLVFAVMVAAIGIITTLYPGGTVDLTINGALTAIP